MSKTDHPFQPGVEVAIRTGGSMYDWSHWRTDRVRKVHKTGRFVLSRDTNEQWRAKTEGAWGDQPARAFADLAGGDRRRVFLLSDVKAEMEEDQAKALRFNRLIKIRARLREAPTAGFTNAMLDAIEANLPPEVKSND